MTEWRRRASLAALAAVGWLALWIAAGFAAAVGQWLAAQALAWLAAQAITRAVKSP